MTRKAAARESRFPAVAGEGEAAQDAITPADDCPPNHCSPQTRRSPGASSGKLMSAPTIPLVGAWPASLSCLGAVAVFRRVDSSWDGVILSAAGLWWLCWTRHVGFASTSVVMGCPAGPDPLPCAGGGMARELSAPPIVRSPAPPFPLVIPCSSRSSRVTSSIASWRCSSVAQLMLRAASIRARVSALASLDDSPDARAEMRLATCTISRLSLCIASPFDSCPTLVKMCRASSNSESRKASSRF